MNEHIASQCDSGVIINTTCTVGDIAHDDRQCISEPRSRYKCERRTIVLTSRRVPFYDIRDRARKHLEALGHL
jgi:hypothetical protein